MAQIALSISFFLSVILAILSQLHSRKRDDLRAVQACHANPTSRLGGMALALKLIVAWLVFPVAQSTFLVGLILCSLPVFAAGLGEDAGWHVAPIRRLVASVCSGFLVIMVLDAAITRMGLAPLDGIFALPLPSLFLTALMLTGVTHAFNMVDGLHGLCGFASLITGGALALIGLKSGQDQAVQALWIVMAAKVGLLLVNFPRGLLFLGDAGAYLTGFVLACIVVKMLQEQPDLSPWAVVLVFFWPLADMVFAVARRLGQRKSAFRADKMHGHRVVLRSLEILVLGKKWSAVSNPLATLILLPAMIAPAALGVVFWNQNGRACALVVAAMICFVLAYHSLVAAAQRRRFRLIGGAGREALKQKRKVGRSALSGRLGKS